MNYFLLLSVCGFFLTSSCNRGDDQKNKDTFTEISDNNATGRTNPYTGYYLYGSNMGWKNGNWKDEDVADLLVGNKKRNWEGVGANSLRPALYESFVEEWGYDIRLNTFAYYSSIGAKTNVAFIGDRPAEHHREKKQYVPGVASESYENLYEPVWIRGEDGISVNENNYYAAYVYRVVQLYKDHVKFWEIKNEPDFTYAPACGEGAPGTGCNWWDKDPSPETLVNLHAPIQSYIRMLRVSYEVIKQVDPDAFVCVGGIGYASFLDAILRNTDNPDGGKVTEEYPYTGGAWFDCLSFHVYPMYYLSKWHLSGFAYSRHSDAAVAAVIDRADVLTDLLKKYGYGAEYPAKAMIITETNVPNKQVDGYIGSEEAQRNYLMKADIVAQKHGISGIYVYAPWDDREYDEDGTEYDYKGFYRPIPEAPENAALRMHESGVGRRTVSRLLRERKYDEAETGKLALPSDVDGGAFYSQDAKDHIYVLWAKTTKDRDENASATYRFPQSLNVTKTVSMAWDETRSVGIGNTVELTGSPVFITVNTDIPPPVAVTGVSFARPSILLAVGNTVALAVNIIPDNAGNRKLHWKSADPAIVRIDNFGNQEALSPGQTTITVRTDDGNKTATCNITVKASIIPLSYILLNSSYENMNIGETFQLEAALYPKNATTEMIWSSSDEKIASVDNTGKVTARAPGKITITATPEDDRSKSKGCTVNVSGR